MRSLDMKPPSRLLIIVSGLLAVSVAIAVAAATGANGTRTAKPVAVARRPVSARLYHLIGALGRADRASASSSPLPVAVLEGTTQQLGITPAAAVFAGGVYPSWIIPGSTEVCLVHDALGQGGTAGGICGTISALEQRGLAEADETSRGSTVVLGLVPDGNTSVGVTDADGAKTTTRVTNNVYEITSGDPVSATLKDASGTTITRRLPVISAPPPPSTPGL
jgi:hypothetical protein